jgi:hypothetical protein
MTRTQRIVTSFATVAILAIASQDLRGQQQRIQKPLPPATDLQQAQVIEIRNESGIPVLKGTFMTKEDKPNEIEREAKLTGAGTGSAEIEVSKKDGQVKDQELELELARLLYSAPYTLHIDNKEVFAFSADSHGKALLKLSSKITK